ncbi:MAG: zinc ribbon domain-containing protein [Acidobacteria bacterium]|nr:zinc ribbon domain-containing protein [Acidobacteriota bacterium]
MPESCTCGAVLPPDARFCHKCGKPQFESTQPEPEEAPLEPVRAETVAAPLPADVSFGNPHAVRIGLLVAFLSFFTSVLASPVALLPIVCLLGAGFLSVYLYRRRTGQRLSPRGGARMGWMTGLFAFIMLLVVFTAAVLAISDPEMCSRLVEEMRARGAGANAEAVVEAFRSPSGVFQVVVMFFVIFTLFPALGGLLGAKLLDRSRG